jgi:hypothetical protein
LENKSAKLCKNILWKGGTFVINIKSLEIRKLPVNNFAQDAREELVST